MKKYFISVVIMLFIFSGCNNDEVIAPLVTSQDGQIVLKIDRENAPQSVATVTAYLTRTGYTTITGSLNLLSDSTADQTLSNIPIGGWHLKVDASDSMEVLEYTGETDVNILENQTIQVTLTLVPVTSGVGNIYLYVTWGSFQETWIDYLGNPVMTGTNNGYENYGVYQANVMYDDNNYKMWFTGLNGDGMGVIEYAESVDGINWIRPVNHPVLFPGLNWDSESVSLPTVLKEDNHYKMYYQGRVYLYGPWHIGLATSPDGITWTKHPTPVLYAGTGWEYQIQPTEILKKDEIYYLYYDGVNYSPPSVETRIALATSTDGINFIRSPQNPILTASQSWEGGFIFDASVIMEDGIFKMIYSSSLGYGTGEATSLDGINWTKSPNNPLFTPQNTYNNWTDWVGYAHYRKLNNEYKIYYGAISTNYYCRIGLLTKN